MINQLSGDVLDIDSAGRPFLIGGGGSVRPLLPAHETGNSTWQPPREDIKPAASTPPQIAAASDSLSFREWVGALITFIVLSALWGGLMRLPRNLGWVP